MAGKAAIHLCIGLAAALGIEPGIFPLSIAQGRRIIALQRRGKPAAVRRREIADVAADLFARQGFGVSTRTISNVLGVTQATLYRHFRSKDELIEEVFRLRYLEEKPSNFAAMLAQRERPLCERLTAAYIDFFAGISETSLKLFQRAAQDQLELIERYSPHPS